MRSLVLAFDIPKGGGTTDSDIESRRILAVDCDVVAFLRHLGNRRGDDPFGARGLTHLELSRRRSSRFSRDGVHPLR